MPKSKADIIAQFAQHVSPGKVAFYQSAGLDFVMGERQGIFMHDVDSGLRLINCHSNGGVFNLGHRHPRIVAALRDALEHVDIGNHHLISGYRAELGARLAATAPEGLNQVVYGSSGGEIVDTAIKLARAHTGRAKVISARGGYHGHTGLALAAGDEQYRQPFGPQPDTFAQVPFGDADALAAELSDDVAAVILETIPATLGIVLPPDDYLAQVRELCDEHGAVFICDEIQTGLGRCGQVWGIDTYGVAPDIIVTAKGLSGGIYPITAMMYHERMAGFLRDNPFIHVSTFGGAELGCVVALAVLDMLQEPDFLPQVRRVADVFAAGFADLRANHPALLLDTRQRGLMMGLKLANDMCGPLMSVLGFKFGLFTVYANNDTSVSQLLPPLIITEDEARQVIAALDGMLGALGEQVGK